MEFLDVRLCFTADVCDVLDDRQTLRAGRSRFRHGALDSAGELGSVGGKINLDSHQAGRQPHPGVHHPGDRRENNKHLLSVDFSHPEALDPTPAEIAVLRWRRPKIKCQPKTHGRISRQLNNLDVIQITYLRS
jgi:hypothetical protein